MTYDPAIAEPAQLRTARLVLRQFELARDLPELFQLNTDPEVVRYTGDGPFVDMAEAQHFFELRMADYVRVGMGRWAVETHAGEWLGWCGLRPLPDSHEVDLGYRFHRRYWGQGYATEAAAACLDLGFGPLGLDAVIARIDPHNAGSRAVARKLGMRELPTPRDCGGVDALVYEITAEEWHQRGAGNSSLAAQ